MNIEKRRPTESIHTFMKFEFDVEFFLVSWLNIALSLNTRRLLIEYYFTSQ